VSPSNDAAPKPGHRSRTVGRRLSWLLLCLAAGSVVAALGLALQGSPAWWLAVPAAVAIGWLRVADPTECEPPRGR